MSHIIVIYRESIAQGGGEHYKGGTDFHNMQTSLVKDLSRVSLEIVREAHYPKTRFRV